MVVGWAPSGGEGALFRSMGRHEPMRRLRTPRMEMGVPAGVQVRTPVLKMNLMAHRMGSGITCVSVDEWMSRFSDDVSTHVVFVIYEMLYRVMRQGASVAQTCLLRVIWDLGFNRRRGI